MESFKPLIAKVAAGAQLTRAEAAAAFESMLSGDATPAQVGGFLMALRVRGEAVCRSTPLAERYATSAIAKRASTSDSSPSSLSTPDSKNPHI